MSASGDRVFGWAIGTAVGWVIMGGVSFALLWTPVMGPWAQERRGLADFREAEQNRKIAIEEAQARKQSSILAAEGEKEAAQLRADAIEIIGEAAQRFPEYRQQEFIGAFADALQQGKIGQIIYVPTEANIPLMEAGKR